MSVLDLGEGVTGGRSNSTIFFLYKVYPYQLLTSPDLDI